jgi:hypothetical protein
MNTDIVIIGAVLLLTLYLLSSNKTASNSEYYYYGDRYEAQANAEIARKKTLIQQNENRIAFLEGQISGHEDWISKFQQSCSLVNSTTGSTQEQHKRNCDIGLPRTKNALAITQAELTRLFQQNQTLQQGLHG